MIITLFFDYYKFWYTTGFLKLLKYLRAYIQILADTFSVKVLVKTFFAPWRRDVMNTQDLPLDQKFKVWIMNIVSRVFGSFIKSVTLIVFLICFTILIILEATAIIVWLLLPIVIVEGIVVGILFFITG